MRANTFDIGGGDANDLITGSEALIDRGIADPKCIGIKGWSYGAILGGYTITRTRLFGAAILGAMVSDWSAEYGNASYDMERWYIGGNPWTEPQRWRERSSLTHANKIRTPTLLHHGDGDTTDWPFQSMDFYAALHRVGTPVRLVRYPDEGHDLAQPVHVRLRDTLDVAWMNRWLRGENRGTGDSCCCRPSYPSHVSALSKHGE
jgi:dipeptidyl aminopeptidase/acylaminoacyl peptidase